MTIIETAPTPIVPPGMIYHVTSGTRRRSILAKGIEPRSGRATTEYEMRWGPRIYFCESLHAAYDIVQQFTDRPRRPKFPDQYIIIEVNAKKMPTVIFYIDEDYDFGLWTADAVPPSAITNVLQVDEEYTDTDEYQDWWDNPEKYSIRLK